jgi:hypothetical protein
MAEKSADVICKGKVVHRNDSLRRRGAVICTAMAQQREAILLKGVNDLNDLQIFSNPEFGSIRTVKEDTTHE